MFALNSGGVNSVSIELGQFADISIGDSWNIIPLDNNAGNSLIICRSQMGLEIVKAAVKAGVIIVEQRTTKEISISQKKLIECKR